MGAMGERFVLFRLPEVDPRAQGRRALSHAGREKTMRRELSAAVAAFFAAPLQEPSSLNDDDAERLVSLATLVARCRSAVERDGYRREIELIPEPEAPTRLTVVLARLLAGLDAIGASRERAWRVVTKAALDSIPAPRRAAIDELTARAAPANVTALAADIGYPKTTARRILEDLAAHGIATRYHDHDDGDADEWALTDFARDLYTAARSACVSEMSSNTQSERLEQRQNTLPDVSETLPRALFEAAQAAPAANDGRPSGSAVAS
jgi:DNA-binding MarR family transcriptional regulator